jgi:thymidylate synthase
MTKLISGETCPEVWLKACNYLLTERAAKGHQDWNVVLEITSPSEIKAQDKNIYKEVDTFLTSHGVGTITTVANTIFPHSLYISGGKDGMFEQYPKMIERFPKKQQGGWGTYACRMMKVRTISGEYINPLKTIIDKINQSFTKGGSYGKCYELGLLNFDGDMQLYDSRSDAARIMGGPCLSHISVKVVESRFINVTALYRNHFYIQRLLGNLIGLAQLQGFIAKETKMQPGTLVVHSTSAEIDTNNWNLAAVKALAAKAQTAPGKLA